MNFAIDLYFPCAFLEMAEFKRLEIDETGTVNEECQTWLDTKKYNMV